MKLNLNSTKFLGEAAVFRIDSRTRPGRYHYCMKLRDGGMICSCEGWQYSGHCHHIDDIPPNEMQDVLRRWRVPEESSPEQVKLIVRKVLQHSQHGGWYEDEEGLHCTKDKELVVPRTEFEDEA